MSKLRIHSAAKGPLELVDRLVEVDRDSQALKASLSSLKMHKAMVAVVVALETFSRSLRKCLVENKEAEGKKCRRRAKTS